MDERELRGLLGQVKTGRLSRRSFVETMLGLGLTAPMVQQMFASVGVAQAQPKSTYAPTKRGGGGALKVLWWQSPTLLNPHFAVGTKDQDGSRIFYEPLAAFEPDGNLVPILAAEVPSLQNGGLRVRALVDRNADAFRRLTGTLQISNDDFIRTATDPRHREGAQRFWAACARAGDV